MDTSASAPYLRHPLDFAGNTFGALAGTDFRPLRLRRGSSCLIRAVFSSLWANRRTDFGTASALASSCGRSSPIESEQPVPAVDHVRKCFQCSDDVKPAHARTARLGPAPPNASVMPQPTTAPKHKHTALKNSAEASNNTSHVYIPSARSTGSRARRNPPPRSPITADLDKHSTPPPTPDCFELRRQRTRNACACVNIPTGDDAQSDRSTSLTTDNRAVYLTETLEQRMDAEIYFGEDPPDEVQNGHDRDADEFLAKNSFRIIYQTNNFFLPQIREMIKNRETTNLRPEYQRRLRWTNTQKSKLIESLLLNIPVPPVFFFEANEARYEVMDGQQRLSAISDFFSGDYALSGLKVLEPLNGLRYTKCTPRVKRSLERATISVIVLLKESESERLQEDQSSIIDVRRLVFDRLNTGGRQLNAQEIRNALNPGRLNECIIECSRFKLFTEVFGIPPYTEDNQDDCYENPDRQKNSLYSSMRDCELVLRFVALRDHKNIRGSMKSMLDRAMERRLDDHEANLLVTDFRSRFAFLYDLFDTKPFMIPANNDRKRTLSAALYDASMVAMDRVWSQREQIERDRERVYDRLSSAIDDDDKYELIVGRKNTAESVHERIELLTKILLPE